MGYRMDKSRFDDIIREKLESHVDPSRPSGAEMSRLFAEIPKPASSAISTMTKVLIAISSVLVIITIFLIYRNYRLEETMRSMQEEIIELGKGGTDVTYFPDTLFWDSLQSITRRIVVQSQDAQRSESSSTIPFSNTSTPSISSLDQVQLSAVDSQKFVNQVIEQLIATVENNPQLLEELLRNVPVQRFSLQDSIQK